MCFLIKDLRKVTFCYILPFVNLVQMKTDTTFIKLSNCRIFVKGKGLLRHSAVNRYIYKGQELEYHSVDGSQVIKKNDELNTQISLLS